MDPMVNSPLKRPAISWGGVALGGVPLDSHDQKSTDLESTKNFGIPGLQSFPSRFQTKSTPPPHLCPSPVSDSGTQDPPMFHWDVFAARIIPNNPGSQPPFKKWRFLLEDDKPLLK